MILKTSFLHPVTVNSAPAKETSSESPEPKASVENTSTQATEAPEDVSKSPPSDAKPDPDAWIQVEKRHRQPSGKAKVLSFMLCLDYQMGEL